MEGGDGGPDGKADETRKEGTATGEDQEREEAPEKPLPASPAAALPLRRRHKSRRDGSDDAGNRAIKRGLFRPDRWSRRRPSEHREWGQQAATRIR